MRHKWTVNDEIVALYLYRTGDAEPLISVKNASVEMGMSLDSLTKKLRNFSFRDGKGGLSGISSQGKLIFDRYQKKSDQEFDVVALPLIAAILQSHISKLESQIA
jgi:hypothetical protein